MKKRFLLVVIPALLVLSGCKSPYSAAATKVGNFKEDTLAHSEIFGQKLQPKFAPAIDDDTGESGTPSGFTLVPKIGVQYSSLYDDNSKYAIRIVAAIGDITDITATWKRGILQPNGEEKSSASFGLSHDVAVETAYENIKNGEDDYTPATGEGTGFTHYVVYTIYDLPAATDLSGYYLFAELTLSRDGETDVVSKTAVTELKQSGAKVASLPKDKKYFIMGTINGVANSILPLDSSLTDSNRARKTGINLKADDKFGVYKMESSSFVFLDNSASNTYDTYYIENDDSLVTDYSKVRATGRYTMFVNGDDTYGKFGFQAESLIMNLYLDSNIWGNGSGERFAINYEDSPSWNWELMTPVDGETNLFKCSLDVAAHPVLILTRMNTSGEVGWGIVYNQTYNITYYYSEGSVLNNKFRITQWHEWNDDNKPSLYERSSQATSASTPFQPAA